MGPLHPHGPRPPLRGNPRGSGVRAFPCAAASPVRTPPCFPFSWGPNRPDCYPSRVRTTLPTRGLNDAARRESRHRQRLGQRDRAGDRDAVRQGRRREGRHLRRRRGAAAEGRRGDRAGKKPAPKSCPVLADVSKEADVENGIVLQSYLYRTYADAEELLKLPARIRICKGAYNEPPEVAFPDKKDVDANYVKVMQLLLASGTYHGIATHDPKMIDATIDFAKREGIGKEKFEFQMLYGVRRDLQRQLARDGFNVRIYVPYGKHWYPYFMRRLAERPANVWFVLKNLAKG